MASVTFSSTVGGNGSTVSDDSNPTTGLGNGGHRTRLVPALAQVVAVANKAVDKAAEALGYAQAAQAATVCTSNDTELLSNTNAVTFATQTGLNIVVGMYMRAASTAAPATDWMSGFVTNYASGLLTIKMDTKGSGSGSPTSWSISTAATTAGSVQNSRLVNTSGLATGGGDLTVDRTIIVPKAAGGDIAVGTDDAKAVTSKAMADAAASVALTDGVNITPDFSTTFARKVTLAGTPRTIGAPTGVKLGFSYALEIIQDATGGRTVTWNSAYDWGSTGAPTLSAGANKRDIVFLYCYDPTTPKLAASFWKAG